MSSVQEAAEVRQAQQSSSVGVKKLASRLQSAVSTRFCSTATQTKCSPIGVYKLNPTETRERHFTLIKMCEHVSEFFITTVESN